MATAEDAPQSITYKDWLDTTRIAGLTGLEDNTPSVRRWRRIGHWFKSTFAKRGQKLKKIDRALKKAESRLRARNPFVTMTRSTAIAHSDIFDGLARAIAAWIRSKQGGNPHSLAWQNDVRNHAGAITKLWRIFVEGGPYDTINQRRWSNQYVLAVFTGEDENTVAEAAVNFVQRYRIPRDRRFYVLVADDYFSLNYRPETTLAPFGFRQMIDPEIADEFPEDVVNDTTARFTGATQHDRLFVVAHGSTTKIGDLIAQELVDFLWDMGLRTIGVISFKSCKVGAGNLVKDFANKLTGKAVQFGFVHGYKFSVAVTDEGRTRIHPDEREDEWPQFPQKVTLDDVDRKTIVNGPLAEQIPRRDVQID